MCVRIPAAGQLARAAASAAAADRSRTIVPVFRACLGGARTF